MSNTNGSTERRTTPMLMFFVLAAVDIGLAVVISATDLAPAVDFTLLVIQLVILAVIIALGVRNQRIFRSRS